MLRCCPRHEVAIVKASAWLEKATKEERLHNSFVSSVTRMLGRDWNGHAKAALKAGLAAWDGKTFGKTAAAKIVRAVEKKLDGFGDKTLKAVNEEIEVLYEAQVADFLKKSKLVEKVTKATATGPAGSLTVSFTQKDKDAIKMLQKFTRISAGAQFPEEVIGKVAQVTSMIVLEEGQDTGVAAEVLKAELEKELAGALGLEISDLIPTAFETNPEAYFEVLANNASVMSQNSGRLIGMDDAGVKKYRVVAVIDERTSTICRGMNGRTISVKAGMSMLEQALGLSTPAQLKELFPWDSELSDLGPNTIENNDSLAKNGLGFPPYHGNCRTTVIPEF